MLNKCTAILTTTCCLSSALPGTSTLAEEEIEKDAVQCINGKNIARTMVVDERNILFYMRDKIIYLNELPIPCPGLASAENFSYRSNFSRLCSINVITVLNDYGGGLSRGTSCGLGEFHPISADEAEAQEGEKNTEPASLPPAERDEPEDPD